MVELGCSAPCFLPGDRPQGFCHYLGLRGCCWCVQMELFQEVGNQGSVANTGIAIQGSGCVCQDGELAGSQNWADTGRASVQQGQGLGTLLLS